MPKSMEVAWLKFFVPVYFALVGARLDLIHHFDAAYFVVFLAFACVVKAVSIYAGARAAGESHSASLNLAAALNARGGPGIVLAAVSYEAGIINENFFAILVLTAVVTSLAAGSWLGRVVRTAHRCAAEGKRMGAGRGSVDACGIGIWPLKRPVRRRGGPESRALPLALGGASGGRRDRRRRAFARRSPGRRTPVRAAGRTCAGPAASAWR